MIEGGRPTIRRFATAGFSQSGYHYPADTVQIAKFRPNDQVKVVSNGPGGPTYRVSEVKGGKYILCDDKGKEVRQGHEYDQDQLELVEDLF